MSTLRTINQIMSIASKAHYLNGGNASKVLAKDKKGIFTIEQVAETLQCDPVELKQLLQQNDIMCGDYVIAEEWGDGEKLSTYALRTLKGKTSKQQSKFLSFLGFKQPKAGQEDAPLWAKIACSLIIASVVLLIMDYPLLAIVAWLIAICFLFKPACKQFKDEHPDFVNTMNKPIVKTIITILKVIGYVVVVGLGGIVIGAQLNCFIVTFGIWGLAIVIPVIRYHKK